MTDRVDMSREQLLALVEELEAQVAERDRQFAEATRWMAEELAKPNEKQQADPQLGAEMFADET